MNTLDVVEATWAEVECRIRPLRRMVFLRTLPLETMIGSIHLPAKMVSFHGELPHMKTIYAIVCSAGPDTTVKIGDKVCFTRLQFAWYKKLEDKCMLGWIDENDITGTILED